MIHPKIIDYKDDEILLARFAKALGHPARIIILKCLSEAKDCFCQEMVDKLPIAQATVSQHLKVLKQSGLICGNIDPPRVRYCIDQGNLKKAKHLFAAFLK